MDQLADHEVALFISAGRAMNQSPDPDVMEISTDDLPEHERLPVWCEVFGRKIAKLQIATTLSGNHEGSRA
jgi:hypothetical protein